MIDVLGLQDSKQTVAALEKLSAGLSTLSDVYVVSTFRLPAKLGGVLLGLYSKEDNRKYLELAVMGKINKGEWRKPRTAPNLIQFLFFILSFNSVVRFAARTHPRTRKKEKSVRTSH